MLISTDTQVGNRAAAFPEATDGGKPTVLIVDDEAQIVTAMADALDDRYNVIGRTSAIEALDILESNKDIRVVLSDQRMPKMSGDEFLLHARELSRAPRILITAYADLKAVIAAVNRGKIFGYLQKPWDQEELLAVVGAAAEHFALKEAIHREKELFRSVMDSSLDGIGVKDTKHQYVRLNDAERRILGARNLLEVEGQSHERFLDEKRGAEWTADEDKLLSGASGVCKRVEHVRDESGTECWYSLVKTPVRSSNGEILGIVSVTRDVTEGQTIAQIKDNFISTVRHELRTPLTIMSSSVKLLSSGVMGSVPAKMKELLAQGEHACVRLEELINNILDVQDILSDSIEMSVAPVKLRDLIYESMATVAQLCNENQIEMWVDGGIPKISISGDQQRLVQALSNVLSNACRFSDKQSEVRIMAFDRADRIQISIIDEGPGVPPSFEDKMFNHFTQADNTTSRSHDGAGLGLFICRLIVERHAGQVGYRRNPERGAEFYIELPKAPAAADAPVE